VMAFEVPVAPVAYGPTGTLRIGPVARLAVVEAGRMVRHPAFLAGLAIGLYFVVQSITIEDEPWAGYGMYEFFIGWAFLWTGAMLAAGMVAGRQRWLGDPDLFPGTPLGPSGRAVACVLALAGPAAVVAGAAVAAGLIVEAAGGFPAGEAPYASVLHPGSASFAQPVFLVVLAGAVGILVSQLRFGRLPLLISTVVVTLFVGIAPWMFFTHPLRVLVPFMFPAYELVVPGPPAGWTPTDPPLLPPGEYSSDWRELHLDSAALGWHLLSVGGLVLLATWAACRLAGSERPPRWLARVGLLLGIGGAALAVLTAGHNGWGAQTTW
jgi:hypothetical protein